MRHLRPLHELHLHFLAEKIETRLWGAEPPRVLHYGLLWVVKDYNYAFDKAWFKKFDPQQCPPWDLSQERPTAGLFPLPPSPSTFTTVTVRRFLCPSQTFPHACR